MMEIETLARAKAQVIDQALPEIQRDINEIMWKALAQMQNWEAENRDS